MRKNKYHGAGFFTRNKNVNSGPLRKTIRTHNISKSASGPSRKTIRSDNVLKSTTSPLRKTIRRNKNKPSSGPLRKTIKRNNVIPPPVELQIRNISLNVTKNNKNNINIAEVESTAENPITLQHLWYELYGNNRYDELFDYVLAGGPIDFSTVPKDEGWLHDLNVYLVRPSTTKIKTLMNFAPTRSLLSKSLISLGISKDFITVLMDRYKELSNDDKMKFIEHVKKYAEQYASTTSTLRIE